VLRVAAAVLLGLGVAGCDWGRDVRPDAFSFTVSGELQRTVIGGHAYTVLTRYTGIGSGDSYGIVFRSAPLGSDASIYDWTVPDSVAQIRLSFGRAEAPRGTYTVEEPPFVGASVWLDGDWYRAQAGTVAIEPGLGRLVGTFRLTDLYRLTVGPSDLVVEGTFDIARDEF
jgi:hypothetical protein